MSRIKSFTGGIFFYDASGDTDKTFLTNILLSSVRAQRKVALTVASSAIADTLLTGGRTAQSTFQLPLDLVYIDHQVCNINRVTNPAKLFHVTCFRVWDECIMAYKGAFLALDRKLKNIRHNNRHMGGVTILQSGDFGQMFSVVKAGTAAEELHACLKGSYMWDHIERRILTTNMKVRQQRNLVTLF